ncbi:MAG TPA: hypothetical protein VIM11_25265 [Tepidisphaeraceae bacterium]
MPPTSSPTPIKYAAILKHVQEVTLTGTADLDFWKNRLEPQNLLPAEHDGRARVMVIAAAGRFAGITFREVSFSILLSGADAGENGAYLLGAFNSVRFFAFCERAFFSTPYSFGAIQVSTVHPVSIQVMEGDDVVFQAKMPAIESATARVTSLQETGGWNGPVFLPPVGREKKSQRKFFARISGHTKSCPFFQPADLMTIRPSRTNDAPNLLIDSNFIPTQWAIREDATHAKSKTYKRAAEFPI